MYIYNNGELKLMWPTSSIVESLCLRTVYDVRSVKLSEDPKVNNIDEFAISEDEHDFIIEHLSESIYRLYAICKEYIAEVGDDSLYINQKIDDLSQGNTSGFTLRTRSRISDGVCKVFDGECYEFIVNEIMYKWWESIHAANMLLIAKERRALNQVNLKSVLNDISRSGYLRSYKY